MTAVGACAPKNLTDDLGRTYINAQVYPINTVSYYVRNNPSGQPALYRKINLNPAEELIEGIEQMQILYGSADTKGTDDTSDDSFFYVTADAIPPDPADPVGTPHDWSKVFSVRVSLLVVNTDDLADKPASYTYNGEIKTPPEDDRRLRKVFTSIIALRNRLS